MFTFSSFTIIYNSHVLRIYLFVENLFTVDLFVFKWNYFNNINNWASSRNFTLFIFQNSFSLFLMSSIHCPLFKYLINRNVFSWYGNNHLRTKLCANHTRIIEFEMYLQIGDDSNWIIIYHQLSIERLFFNLQPTLPHLT